LNGFAIETSPALGLLGYATIDLAILLVYMAGVVLLGLWVGRGTKDLSGYLLGGRNVPWWAILGSIVATETSTVTFLSVPGILYAKEGNLTFLQLTLGYIIGRILVVLLFLPRYFRGELFTAYEVLHERFGKTTKRIASLLFIITRTLADGLRLYLTAIVLEKVAGIQLETSVIVIGIGTVFYTFVGGMKSVVWNDCIQLVVYLVGAVVAGVILLNRIPGGMSEVIEYGQENGKFKLIELDWQLANAYTLWAGLFGGIFVSMASHGTDQLMVQRYLCAKSQRHAATALSLSGFIVAAQFALFLLLGVALACFYQNNPFPEGTKGDQIFATFIVDEIPPVLCGFILAAVFSAAMSTLSSSLNSSATAVVNDFLKPQDNSPVDVEETESTGAAVADATVADATAADAKLTMTSRLWTIVFGVLQIIVGIGANRLPDEMNGSVIGTVLAIASFTTGIILGLFFLSRAFQGATEKGALTGTFVGILVTLAIVAIPVIKTSLTGAGYENLPSILDLKIAWPWYSVIGSMTTLSVGALVSSFTSNK